MLRAWPHELSRNEGVCRAAGRRSFERALALEPRSASTLAALGLTLHVRGARVAAIERYHQALALCPDHSLAGDLLAEALMEESLAGAILL